MDSDTRRAAKLAITGHAGLFLTAGAESVLVDPWLGGSAYWRSWWQYPPPGPPTPEMLAPGHLMLSHAHFDHFHFPSMRRIDRETEVLVPKFAVDVMVGELASLGFHNVVELDHGRRRELAGGLSVASYQYGLDDTLIVIEAGDVVIYDMNDCKIRGRALHAVLDEFGPPTFLLKNYSAAQAYPHCYRAADAAELAMISPDSYIEDFLDSVRAIRPRYAVPFASMVCFLHPDTVEFNETVVTPDRVAAAFRAAPVEGTELVVLAPGDHWSATSGFQLDETDWYGERSVRIDALGEQMRERIAASLVEEASAPASFDRFANYLHEFLNGVPFLLRRMFTRPVVFALSDSYWVVNLAKKDVTRSSERPERWATTITIAPGLLNDAIEKRILNLVHISMRLEIELAEGGLTTDMMFWALLIIFELGYFPLSKLDRRRTIAVAWSRRREFLDMALAAARTRGSLAERLATSFISTSSA